MSGTVWIQPILIAAGALAAAAGFALRRSADRRAASGEEALRKSGGKKTVGSLLLIGGAWLFLTRLLLLTFDASATAASAAAPKQISVLGLQLPASLLFLWAIMLLLFFGMLLLRLLFIPRMKDLPGRGQLVLEVLFGFGRRKDRAEPSLLKAVFSEISLSSILQDLRGERDRKARQPSRHRSWILFSAICAAWLLLSRFLLFALSALHWWTAPLIETPRVFFLFGNAIQLRSPVFWMTWGLIIVISVLLRLFFVPHMRETPARFQVLLELLFRPPRRRSAVSRERFGGREDKEKDKAKRTPLPAEQLVQIRKRRKKRLLILLGCAGFWLAGKGLLTLLFGQPEKTALQISMTPEQLDLFGLPISSTVAGCWAVSAVLVFFALLLRIFFIPRMRETPNRFQLIIELAVTGISDYTNSKVGGEIGYKLSGYIFTLALMMLSLDSVELFGFRPSTADINMTAAMAIISFFLIHGYGIRYKKLLGHLRALASPAPFVFPLRLITEFAVPISLACRLFGNTFGGMIVMDLLYHSLGTGGLGIPSLAGLYFNVFHPLVQAFIFITLTLTFIGEATETNEA